MNIDKWGLVVNCIVNALMLAILGVYFLSVFTHIKLRSNIGSKIQTILVAVALILRFCLSLYDCIISIDEVTEQYWRFYITYFIGIMFMLIYLTLIFRVIGSWTLFS